MRQVVSLPPAIERPRRGYVAAQHLDEDPDDHEFPWWLDQFVAQRCLVETITADGVIRDVAAELLGQQMYPGLVVLHLVAIRHGVTEGGSACRIALLRLLARKIVPRPSERPCSVLGGELFAREVEYVRGGRT
ncbi:hypothetical protein JQ617_09685 [Bradyrhizobium sp. KB893862 SZCCT0404]|uniref:hypothetical protein n=1 Tax=Bradyrhizobium sp. KB893862 SZCCT0404 TaxID=2807672 RepID=UPI001BA80E8C|nr:hypothetical protein [Bradyrhizobium sp. KB893862 SZCCT0404]MBR1174224.1 hypothetical protein [Bradyrhizobium sp. KB893862 SZCCT0404]